jgi:hypothetical protein
MYYETTSPDNGIDRRSATGGARLFAPSETRHPWPEGSEVKMFPDPEGAIST